MAVLLAFTGNDEPRTAQEVAWQCRLDDVVAQDVAGYLSGVVIPAARQLAETRSGVDGSRIGSGNPTIWIA